MPDGRHQMSDDMCGGDKLTAAFLALYALLITSRQLITAYKLTRFLYVGTKILF